MEGSSIVWLWPSRRDRVRRSRRRSHRLHRVARGPAMPIRVDRHLDDLQAARVHGRGQRGHEIAGALHQGVAGAGRSRESPRSASWGVTNNDRVLGQVTLGQRGEDLAAAVADDDQRRVDAAACVPREGAEVVEERQVAQQGDGRTVTGRRRRRAPSTPGRRCRSRRGSRARAARRAAPSRGRGRGPAGVADEQRAALGHGGGDVARDARFEGLVDAVEEASSAARARRSASRQASGHAVRRRRTMRTGRSPSARPSASASTATRQLASASGSGSR